MRQNFFKSRKRKRQYHAYLQLCLYLFARGKLILFYFFLEKKKNYVKKGGSSVLPLCTIIENAGRWLQRQEFDENITYDELVHNIRQKYCPTPAQRFQLRMELTCMQQRDPSSELETENVYEDCVDKTDTGTKSVKALRKEETPPWLKLV